MVEFRKIFVQTYIEWKLFLWRVWICDFHSKITYQWKVTEDLVHFWLFNDVIDHVTSRHFQKSHLADFWSLSIPLPESVRKANIRLNARLSGHMPCVVHLSIYPARVYASASCYAKISCRTNDDANEWFHHKATTLILKSYKKYDVLTSLTFNNFNTRLG